jgi:hypothetical protein
MKRSFPDMFAAQPDLLFQLVTMLHPAVLRKHGVPVYTTLQARPPLAHHSGPQTPHLLELPPFICTPPIVVVCIKPRSV